MTEAPHGDVSMYWRGCRCLPCRSAAARWKASRRHAPIARSIDAAPAREHLAKLSAEGVGLDQVSRLTGLDRRCIWEIRCGRSVRARRDTVDRILACPMERAGGAVTTAWWTKKYVHALLQEGYSYDQIAHWVGVNVHRIGERVRQATARRAERVYREITGEADSALVWGVSFQTITGASIAASGRARRV